MLWNATGNRIYSISLLYPRFVMKEPNLEIRRPIICGYIQAPTTKAFENVPMECSLNDPGRYDAGLMRNVNFA
jgi:hypothetical protein